MEKNKHILPLEAKTHHKVQPGYEGGNTSSWWCVTQSKHMTPLSVPGALARCAPYDRKSKQWMEITDAVRWRKNRALCKWLKSLTEDTTSAGRQYLSVLLGDKIKQLLRSYRVYLLSVKQLFYHFLHILLRKNHLTELNVLYWCTEFNDAICRLDWWNPSGDRD